MGYRQRQLLRPIGDVALELALGKSTFVAGMAKRTAPGPFAAAPIIQGKWDGTGTPDVVSFPPGDLIGNQAGYWRDNFDPYQGSVVFWITPEWAGNDGIGHYVLRIPGRVEVFKKDDNKLYFQLPTHHMSVDISGWAAGATHCVVVSWDTKNALDGTNHARMSIDNVHTYGVTAAQTTTLPLTSYIGVDTNAKPANALIEGLTVYRRPLWDGDYGVDVGNGDEIALIHAAGVGVDPCLITKGSWDIPFCMPTDSTPGALVTGEGEAWSHPHNKSEPKHSWLADGGYFTEPYAVLFNGTTTVGNCGSGATLDNLPQGASGVTFGAWVRADSVGGSPTPRFLDKGNWYAYMTADGYVSVVVGHADTPAVSTIDADLIDGKLHYITIFFESIATGGDGKVYIAAGGKWASSYISQSVGVGAVDNDAANDFVIGNRNAGARTFDGLIGLTAIWNDDHYNHGTDFIPPRAPESLPDATVVEQWDFDEGTGNTAAAHVTTPANDCALTNHVWEEQWDVEGTPVIPQSVECDGATTSINAGSGATLDNLPNGANGMQAGAWVRIASRGEGGEGVIFVKRLANETNGWEFRTQTTNGLLGVVKNATTPAVSSIALADLPTDDRWHSVLWSFKHVDQGGDSKIYFAVDGIWAPSYSQQQAGVGAYSGDAAEDFHIGGNSSGAKTLDGAIGWSGLWNTVAQYPVGTDFVPPARTSPPGAGGNLVESWAMTDGAGATITATVTSPGNDATLSNGVWNNTPDMEVDEPGARVFGWGYNLGADAANEGMAQIDTGLTPGDDYVLRVPISVGQSGRAQAAIRIYDEIGAAIISTLNGPKYHCSHTGANGSATLTDNTARWPQSLVGWEAYNITDGSHGPITAISGDFQTITVNLAGGTDNDFDTNDVCLIRPPNGDAYCKHPWTETFCIELPAGCTSVSWKVLNPAGEGVVQVHQYEVQESLITNGSLEVGAGNPWIPTGWTNIDLDAGDTEAEAGTVHSGAGSMEWNPGASAYEYMRMVQASGGAGSFFAGGFWHYGDGTSYIRFGPPAGGGARLHYDPDTGEFYIEGSPVASWSHSAGVWRDIGGALYAAIRDNGIAAGGDRFIDDLYALALDPVSLTITPASEANSAESGGLRVDGRDKLTHPHENKLKARSGAVTGKGFRPRHAAADAVKFGQAASYLLDIYQDVNNYIRAYWSAANTITLAYNAQGAGEQTNTWAAAGAWAVGAEKKVTLGWGGGGARLKVDGVTVAQIAGAVVFATDFTTTVKWGQRQDGAMQFGGVAR